MEIVYLLGFASIGFITVVFSAFILFLIIPSKWLAYILMALFDDKSSDKK